MTGAGSATAAYTPEPDYGGGPGADPTWVQPGIDVVVSDLTVQQALERSRHPDSPLPAGSRPRDFEGGLGVEWTLTDANFHDLVFADGGTALPTSAMRAPSATWYFATQMPDGSTEPRTPTGTIVTDAEISYERASDIRVSLTMLYGFEPDDVTAPAEADIQQPSEADAFSYHGTSLSVNTISQPLLQSATLSLTGLSRFRRGQGRHPYDAVTGAIEPSLSLQSTFTERDQLELARADGTPIETIDKTDAVFAFENAAGETIEYTISDVQPTTYSWQDLVAADSDLNESVDFHATNIEVTQSP
ncbi:hypothetical protein DJ68_07835 [Halorubrum sp. C3]|nr:hypothetical protein DJ68_07835 [Halorubrum sp. C3]